ncbi:MAG TPA: oligosaccharide flippase family protein [Solirubrobacteraceae bacterium]|nr:oligosaccharide flippase family protein [Solirubrobacteraceae bacterium]
MSADAASDSAPAARAGGGDVLDSGEAGGRFIRGGSMRVLAYGGGVLASLASVPLVTRHLGPGGWGRYLTVTSLLFIVQALTEGGVANVGVRQYSNSAPGERRRLMRDLLGLRIALTLTGVLAAVAFALLAGYPAVLVEGTAIAGFGLLLLNLQYTLTVPLMAELRLGWQAANDFLGQFVTALSMIALVLAGATLLPFYAVSSLAALATLALTVGLVRRDTPLRPSFRISRWRSLMAESVVYAAATALGAVYFRIVIVALSLIATAKATGYYSLAFRILDVVNAIPWLLVTSAFPILARAARDDRQRLRYALQRLCEGSLVLGGWLALCLVAGAPFAVSVVGGGKYHPSIELLRIIGAGVPATFLLATWSFALLSLRLYRQLMAANGLIVAVALALSAGLIEADGAQGAALVTVTLEVLLAASYLLILVRSHPELRPSLGAVPRILAALALAFAAAVALHGHAVLATLAGSAVFALALLVLRALPQELLVALRERRG